MHLLIVEDDQGHREFTLEAPSYSIGTEPDCEIRLHSRLTPACSAILMRQNLGGTSSYRLLSLDEKNTPTHDPLQDDFETSVRAIFGFHIQMTCYLLRQDPVLALSPDEVDMILNEFDITLIGPNMPKEED